MAVEEGKDVACICYGTNGNPPPTALWSKGCEEISDVGYSKETFYLKNVSKEDAGTYRCTVRSYNLTDEKAIKVIVNCEYITNLQFMKKLHKCSFQLTLSI